MIVTKNINANCNIGAQVTVTAGRERRDIPMPLYRTGFTCSRVWLITLVRVQSWLPPTSIWTFGWRTAMDLHIRRWWPLPADPMLQLACLFTQTDQCYLHGNLIYLYRKQVQVWPIKIHIGNGFPEQRHIYRIRSGTLYRWPYVTPNGCTANGYHYHSLPHWAQRQWQPPSLPVP